MNTYTLTVATPEGNRFHGEVAGLYLRGAEGDLAVLAGHIPFITAVQPGECRIQLPVDDAGDGEMRTGRTEGGLLTVDGDAVTLLSGSFHWMDEE